MNQKSIEVELNIPMAERIETGPPAQHPKPIMVDDVEYAVGEGVLADWALGYLDIGGEG